MAHLPNANRVAQWLLLSAMAGVGLFAQTAPVTDKDVLAIVQRCTQCHGGDVQMGNLDLRTRASILQGGNSGAVITPGHADDSLLIKRATGTVKPQMPMAPVPKLTPEEIAVLKNWIDQGASGTSDNGVVTSAAPATQAIPADLSYLPANFPGYKERVIQDRDREWWAFKKPVRYAKPAVSDARWTKNPIDAFVKKELDAKGLEPAPVADKRTLIRRVYLDLIGLLPPTEVVEAYVKDDSPDAYSKLVDKLLASPNYGERWCRFWLDVVRYADSSGFEYDRDIPNAWRYRDYVIKAFNEDKPFNQFIVEQIAGDELDNPTNDSLTATTFYRIGPRVCGGMSHIDTFQYKPALEKYNRMPMEGHGDIVVRQGNPGPLMKTPFSFKQYGQSGQWVSEIFPHISTIVDDLAFIHSAHGTSNDHTLSHLEWNTGNILVGYPSVGSWVTYGLGTVNQNLPAYVVLFDQRGGPYGGPQNWGSGYLPAAYQGTVFRSQGDPVLDLSPSSEYTNLDRERARLDQLAKLNQEHAERYPGSSELSARIASYELAYRMQGCAPEAVDISTESDETKQLYGLNDPVTEPFGKQCLLARRLVERGVRFVQLISGAYVNTNVTAWDAHDSVDSNHRQHGKEVDKPITGLITDMKRRGLLDQTVVMLHSEFGRMPISQRGVGRDHNPGAMTVFMCGAGIQGGQAIGTTDDVGLNAEEQPTSNHDIHASILNLMGMDHKKLTYYFNGRNMRLTDVAGELVPQITGTPKKA